MAAKCSAEAGALSAVKINSKTRRALQRQIRGRLLTGCFDAGRRKSCHKRMKMTTWTVSQYGLMVGSTARRAFRQGRTPSGLIAQLLICG